MSSGEERLLAGVRPLASTFQGRVLRGGAGAGARRAVEAVGLGSGVPLCCAPRFINRRHLRGEGQGTSFRKVTEGPGEALFFTYRGYRTHYWWIFSGGELPDSEVFLFESKTNKLSLLTYKGPRTLILHVPAFWSL